MWSPELTKVLLDPFQHGIWLHTVNLEAAGNYLRQTVFSSPRGISENRVD